MKRIPGFCILISLCIPGILPGQQPGYKDGRPRATKRMGCDDQGIILRYGNGPDSCDVFGAREALINKENGTYYLFYDGAGKDGWIACLAKSTDLKTWEKNGPVLQLGKPGTNDAKSAAAPWVIKNGDAWHMFYLGTPNTTPPPDRIPVFPYLTMKATARSLEGPWTKQYNVTPFLTKKETFYSVTASPGSVVKSNGEYLQFFSAALVDSSGIKRTLGIVHARDLNGSWVIDTRPIFPTSEQVDAADVAYHDGYEGYSFGHLKRNIGLAWLTLPLKIP